MPYFAVDDQFSFHPKVIAAGNDAVGLWTRAGAWCKAHTTGGFVPSSMVAALGTEQQAASLVGCALWSQVEGGFQFHDWTDTTGNGTADEEKAKRDAVREQNRERKRKERERKGSHAGSHASGHAVTSGGVTQDVTPLSQTPQSQSQSQSQSQDPSTYVERVSHVGNAHENATDEINLSNAMKRVAENYGLLDIGALQDAIRDGVGREVLPIAAVLFAEHTLRKAKRNVRAPQAYVLSAIKSSPFEAQQWVDEGGWQVAS